MNTRTMLLILSSTVLATPPVRAQEAPAASETEVTPNADRRASHVDRLKVMWRFELGYRGAFVTDAGYNPFSTQDFFPQLSMAASRTVYTRSLFSFAPGFAWDYGRTGATSRGTPTSLDVHRLVVPLEGRMHFGTWGYAFVRAAPGVALENAEVDDASAACATPAGNASASSVSPAICAPAPLTKSRWLFATDVSAGYAFPIAPRADPADLVPRVWLQADAGYGWIVTQRLNLAPNLPSSDPRLASGIDLGSLTMRGAFFRIAGAVSF